MIKRKENIFITGAAGFIGFHLCNQLLKDNQNSNIIGIDSLSNYYDVNLKKNRLKILKKNENFKFFKCKLENKLALEKIYKKFKPNIIIHLGAQAGVRYSLENPKSYIDSNIYGSFNVLELSNKYTPDHLLMASTSSIYGANKKYPFSENDKTDHPLSLYAASKKSMELLAHSYSYSFGIPITIFRFFTVYGPWGRPDMAFFKFLDLHFRGEKIEIFNKGQMDRDFTFIDDLIDSIIKLKNVIPIDKCTHDSKSDVANFRIVNIGNSKKINLMDAINQFEEILGEKFNKKFLGMQLGDVVSTEADNRLLIKLIGKTKHTSLKKGLTEFYEWYKLNKLNGK